MFQFEKFVCRLRAAALALALIGSCTAQSGGQSPTQTPGQDLTGMSLEDLMNMQVTSVSKREQKLWTSGAAVFVITQEDIRRSGATNIPDLLRMVPGLNVAQINANSWAVSIRGFNDGYADKVLVLIDGRSVYNPIFSGVNWDEIDVPLEDIERIEVVRGPGGTVWGANAVNGVINIITKSPKDTQGGLIRTGGGASAANDGLVQYGGAIGQTGSYRIFEKYLDTANFQLPSGASGLDGWRSLHEGFRADWTFGSSDTLMVQGDVDQVGDGQLVTSTFLLGNPPVGKGPVDDIDHDIVASVLARWTHTLAGGDEISLQVYENHFENYLMGQLYRIDTGDVDFEDHMAVGSRNDIVWGAGVRVNAMETQPGYSYSFTPPDRTDLLASVFFQDQVRLTGSLSLTLGSKFEHNGYTGFEVEPSAQLVWAPSARHTLWASASRAIRQPDLDDIALSGITQVFPVPGLPYGITLFQGDPHPLAETLNDYEAGYRVQASKQFAVDITAFAGFYRNLITFDQLSPYLASGSGYPYLVVPVETLFNARANTHGGEISGNWDLTPKWRISPGFSLFRESLVSPSDTAYVEPNSSGQSSPAESFELRSQLTLPRNFEWDSSVGYVTSIMGGAIPAYTRVDSRLGWHSRHLQLSLVGQNLLSPRHAEFIDELSTAHTLMPRSVFAQFAWRFSSRP